VVVIQSITFVPHAHAQETIFNVPNGDVLDKSKIYGEIDFAYLWDSGVSSYTPRFVMGVGQRIEVGINLNGITSPGPSQTTVTPTIKWKAYDGGNNGWAVLVGDDLYIPARNRTYDAGNYAYAEVVKHLKSQLRLTVGTYDFTAKVVSNGNKAGGQFGIEQQVGNHLTLAADWFTGNHNMGYFTPGALLQLSPKATLYVAYEIGNSRAISGNRLLLMELGWNFN
jgi:hypothetical protein